MIKLENTEVVGWEHAIRGLRTAMNNLDEGNSGYCGGDNHIGCAHCALLKNPTKNQAMIDMDLKYGYGIKPCGKDEFDRTFKVGYNDYYLMLSLVKDKSIYDKYRQMIVVYVDITAPLYWWNEFNAHEVGKVISPCNIERIIRNKEFELKDFSYEYLIDDEATIILGNTFTDCVETTSNNMLLHTIELLNYYRKKYLNTLEKKYLLGAIQLIPNSYEQRQTIMITYEELAKIYQFINTDGLEEWKCVYDWIESLLFSEIITALYTDNSAKINRMETKNE